MANDLPDLSGEDFRDAGAVLNQNAAALAGLNANANPDEAARSAKLGAVTGVPGNVVHLNPQNFEERLKERAAVGMVGNNPSLAQYAGSDPLASAVSNDDWGTLDTLSHMLHNITAKPIDDAIKGAFTGAVEGVKEGWGDAPLLPVTSVDTEKFAPSLNIDKGVLPAAGNALLTTGLNVAATAIRVLGAGFEGAAGGIGGAVGGLTGSPQLGREAQGFAEWRMFNFEHLKGGPWIRAGVEPPAGIHPELDKAKAEHNETWLKGLEEVTDLAGAKSTTIPRSPEHFKKFVEQTLGEDSIRISGDAVTALYGKETPLPGDGKLGSLPRVYEQVLNAHLDGSDIIIPKADWITFASTKEGAPIAKALRDNIRMWPDGITKAESTVERPQVPPPPTPDAVSQVRAAGGLEPVFRAGPTDVGAAASGHPNIMIGLDTIDPKAVGLPEGHWQKLQELAQAQFEDDLSLAQRRAERQQKREQTAEWKSNRKIEEAQVEAETRSLPHVAADLFIGSGELNGEKLQQRFTLRDADLTPEQKAQLPDHYVSKNGLPIDDVAHYFGFGSGDSLVEALGWHNGLKNGRSSQELFRDLVKAETDRRMEAKYGDLPSNILTAAHDQALSDTTLNLVTQEYLGAAMSSGVDFLKPEQIKAEAKRIADSVVNKDVNSRAKLAEVSKNYSDAVKGLLSGDAQGAILALQRRAIGAHVAKELLDREKAMAKFDKLASGYAKRWDPRKESGQRIAPEWSLMIRDMLGKVGLKNGMSPAWIAQEISNSRFTGLADFVSKVEKESHLVDLKLPIPDFLYEPKVKPLKEMNGEEFRATADAVTMMDHLGRADQKAEVAGEKLTKDEWVSKAVAQLAQKFEPLPSDRKVGPAGALAAASTSAETVFSRFDGRDPHGLFTETFTYPLAEGSNFKNRVEREESKKYLDLEKIRDEKKLIDSPIVDPSTGKPWANFTRKELHAVISNMGNEYNWRIACKGWGVDPDLMWKWVEAHSNVEDIKRAQGLGDQFSGLKSRIDVVDRNVYGVASESVVPRPFEMHGQTFDGWYHPIIGDPVLSRYINKMPALEKEPTNFWPSVYNKFLVKRTGAVQFIALNYDSIPSRLMQQIHYLAMHEPVMNAAKLIRDQRFRDAVIRHYGKEYMEVIDHWLQSAAGDGSYNSGMLAQANKWSGILRQNVVNTQIAFNLGTVQKHGPTAFMYSLRELAPNTVVGALPSFAHVTAEVAPGLFKHAVMDLFGKSPELGDSWFDFVRQHSEEIQRRERNYQDTMMGAHQMFDQGWSLRNSVSAYGAKMVAFSDMLSAAPLWLARYRQEIAANPDDLGAAARAADFSVRRAHGSTAVTSRPMIATGSNPVTPWLTSLYGFMGTSLNRRIEIMHDINDAYKLGMKGDIKEAGKMLPPILSGLAVYVVWTGLIEEAVTGQFTDDKRGMLSKSASFLFGSVANAIIGLRDVAWNVDRGGDSAGMISTPINDVVKVLRDLKLEKTLEGRYNPLAKQNAGKLIQDTCTVLGDLKGYCPKHVGTMLRYGHDAFEGVQHPRSSDDWYRGLITGSQKLYERR